MSMTSRELVYRALEFKKPDRIPRQMWTLPWATNNYPQQVADIQSEFPDDIIGSPWFCNAWNTKGNAYEVGEYIDEWGCAFINCYRGIIGEVKDPLVKKWDQIDRVKLPSEALTVDVSKVNEFCDGTDHFVMAPCSMRPFERLQFLCGTENVMMGLALEQQELFTLLDRIHSFHLEEARLWASTNVDGISFMDDWGSQKALLINPEMWRKIFKPMYKEYIDIIHSSGKKAFMHSDGYIFDILEDLVEIGLDAINSQVFCMGLERLSEGFKGRITFWGEMDRQHLLPYGTEDETIKAVDRFNKCFYDSGGVIAQLEFGAGAKPENVYAAYQAWHEFKCT